MPVVTNDHRGSATLLYFEGEIPVGSKRLYCCGTDGERSAYYPNLVWFCPNCGSVWARAIYDFLFRYNPIPQMAWRIESRPCVSCGDGQLLDDLEGADANLLTRELLAILENYK